VRQLSWLHGPPVTHPMTTGRATTGATGSLDEALRFIHSGVCAHGNSVTAAGRGRRLVTAAGGSPTR
jgi:hypothetical protein